MSVIMANLHSLTVEQSHCLGTFNTSTNPERYILLENRFCCCSCTGSSSSSQVPPAHAALNLANLHKGGAFPVDFCVF
jgi:hypothetical protein